MNELLKPGRSIAQAESQIPARLWGQNILSFGSSYPAFSFRFPDASSQEKRDSAKASKLPAVRERGHGSSLATVFKFPQKSQNRMEPLFIFRGPGLS